MGAPVRRKLPRTLVIGLLLGTATNIAVTALCVWTSTAAPDGAELGLMARDNIVVDYIHYDGQGKTVVWWFALADPLPFDGAADDVAPSWSTAHDARVVDRLAGLPKAEYVPTQTDIAYGWPLRSFCGSVTQPLGAAGPEEHRFIALSSLLTPEPFGGRMRKELRTVPLTPIVQGVLANTALYAALWLMLLFAPKFVRGRSRRRRGACIACGYDRRGIGADVACPECGAAANVVQ